MIFPEWVEGPRMTDHQRATARLKFIINYLAAKHTKRASVRGLAELVELNHCTLSTYIRRGAFSRDAALKIEAKLGRRHIRHEDLTNPLDIKAKATA